MSERRYRLPDPKCHYCRGCGLVSVFKAGDSAATMAACPCTVVQDEDDNPPVDS